RASSHTHGQRCNDTGQRTEQEVLRGVLAVVGGGTTRQGLGGQSECRSLRLASSQEREQEASLQQTDAATAHHEVLSETALSVAYRQCLDRSTHWGSCCLSEGAATEHGNEPRRHKYRRFVAQHELLTQCLRSRTSSPPRDDC